MALDLLSLIAGPSNVDVMTKELILLMLTTPDE